MRLNPRCWFRHDWQEFRPWKGGEIRWCRRWPTCGAYQVRSRYE